MPLIASISGIRGVLGDGLDAGALTRYAAAFGAWCREQDPRPTVVVGRDGRATGDVCARLVTATLQSAGCDVIDAGLATTPTVEVAVLEERATGGVILSASHNPAEWNALKLLNARGEFLTPDEGEAVLALAEREPAAYTVAWDAFGTYAEADYLDLHIQRILELPWLDVEAIARRDFRVVVDGINSVGGFALPALLEAVGVRRERITTLNAVPDGHFAHNPEPLPAHITEATAVVRALEADLGVVVDPDADRLAFIEDGGRFFGEELTQVVAADFLMGKTPGAFVTNLSSSRAIEDVMAKHGHPVHRSAVGEINVVLKMREVGAVLGGEGNGGVILPDLHYGRDALVGTAMVLQHLAETGKRLSEVRAEMPVYHIAKHKLPAEGLDARKALAALAASYEGRAQVSTLDGVKVDLDEGWVHLRTSNTEPIVRVYAEARTAEAADALAERFKDELRAAG